MTSDLQLLSSRLREPDLLEKVTKALGHDTVRNYTDAVQVLICGIEIVIVHLPLKVLVLSGEEECTDAETKSFFCALTNIVEEEVSSATFLILPYSNILELLVAVNKDKPKSGVLLINFINVNVIK